MKIPSICLVMLLGVAASVLVGGCAETMTPAERVKIHTLCVSSRLGQKLTYLRKGTTVFQIEEESLDDNGLLSWVVKATGDLLRSAGYAVVDRGQACDYDLLITPAVTFTYRGGSTIEGIKGAVFFLKSSLAITSGIEVESSFTFNLARPGTAEIRFYGTLYQPIRQSGIRKDAPWNELSTGDREHLMKMLQDQLWTVPGHGLRGLGLM